ncbi:RES family NAD+ phosphorylase [Brevibacterium ammoniilyticum]|uniref:RES family NAD+ phosphorylase n=1 Tax=Brevibacterium ammoniilyticum TaxID=1046555 RepID=UPI003139C836
MATPPDPFEPAEDLVRAGTVLLRVYSPGRSNRAPNDFNPGTSLAVQATRRDDVFPVSRFSFFLDDAEPARPVPTLYASPSENVALWETLLRDRAPDDTDALPRALFRGRMLAQVRARRDLRVASLAGADMHTLNLSPDELTSPGADRYAETIPWARAACRAGFDGIRYVSRRDPSGLAFVFFDSRQSAPLFEPARPGDMLQSFDDLSDDGGFGWLAARLARWGIVAEL